MDVYQHFRKEEQPFIDSIFDIIDQVDRQYMTKFTDFLDPREQHIFTSIVGQDERFQLISFFDQRHMERRMLALAPVYEQISYADFPICLLEASYPVKFIDVRHSDVLGAFISLGIDRKKLGDITIDHEAGIVQLYVTKDISDYVIHQLTQIKKATFAFAEVTMDAYLQSKETWKTVETTVSSMRLDVLVKTMYRLSRSESKEMIQKKLVKVNFKVIEDPSFSLAVGDLISVRRKGRSQLTEINGHTKKDKVKITYQTLFL